MKLILLVVGLLTCSALSATSFMCGSSSKDNWFHGWIRHGDGCNPSIFGCAAGSPSAPFTQWTNIGFESVNLVALGPGRLRNDDTMFCKTPIPHQVTANCSRWAIAELAKLGWNTATYSLKTRACQGLPNDGSPKPKGSICWDFQCAWEAMRKRCPISISMKRDDGNERIVPSDWTCPEKFYHSGDECHCNCGAWDPDCDDQTRKIIGCHEDSICLPPGNVCHDRADTLIDRKLFARMINGDLTHKSTYTPLFGEYVHDLDVPASWKCPREYYGAGDGCDCRCGAFDPDCVDDSGPALNCPAAEGYIPRYSCDPVSLDCVMN